MPVAIAGMHRSGTSMITRLLNLCGLYLGDEKDLIPNEVDNPEGFWEHIKFQAVNEEILSLFGGAWDKPPVFEENWELSPYLVNINKHAKQVIEEVARSSAWGWKDPRTSLTLPFWKKQIPGLKTVICLRNPFDVYHSLARRGYASSVFSYNLWLEYNQRVIASAESEDRIITHYDSFFYDPQTELRRLVDFLEIEASDEMIKNACQTISSKLRHTKSSINSLYDTNPPQDMLNLYRALCLRSGPVYANSLSAEEKDFFQYIVPGEEVTNTAELRKLSKYLQIVNDENAQLKLEIAALQKETTSKIAKILEDKSTAIAKLEYNKATEIAKLEYEKATEITRLSEEKTTEITRLQEERNILQGTVNEIFASRSWRLIRVVQNIRLFFVPLGSRREKILKVIYGLVTFKYVKDFLAVTRMRKELEDALRLIDQMRKEPQDSLSLIDQKGSIPEVDPISTKIYSDLIVTAKGKQKDEYVAISNEDFSSAESLVKLIAFYLPQFHPIPENDEWWGKGFVEWTNVSKAVPQFVGHYQPHLPGELGFYDLRLPDILKRQVELARKYGIHGFAFHYYWFNGRRLLEKPLDLFLKSEEDFPFCICWANENWTRRWDGDEHELLIAQNHSPESDLRFIQDISPILKDPRYIRIDGRPLLIVYRANIIPDIENTVKLWREYCINNGIGDPYLVAAQTFWFEDPRVVDFDAAVEFPPHNVGMTNIRNLVEVCNPNYEGNVYDYSEMIEKKTSMPETEYKVFKTIFPGWDNEARKPEKGNSFAFSSPALYKEWLVRTAKITLRDPDPEKRYIFINAWNEWAEGAHLEPDRKYGYAYLQATVDALKEIGNSQPEK